MPTPVPPIAERIPPALRRVLSELLDGMARWPLYLYGPAGTGKTFAAIWAANQVPDSAYLMLDELTDAIWNHEHLCWHVLRERALVVVDEIGLRGLDREYLAVKRAADLRDMRPSIWVSNLSPEQLSVAYDDRIYSRLCCGTVVSVDGTDQRFL